MIALFGVFFVTLFASSFGDAVEPQVGNGNAHLTRQVEDISAQTRSLLSGCGGYIFVDDEVVIDGPFNQDCIWQFETEEDRILAFSVVDGDMKETQNFLAVSKIYYTYNRRVVYWHCNITCITRFVTVSPAMPPYFF